MIIAFIVILVLDWLALDDITTGNQPSYFWEYAMLVVSIAAIGSIGVFYFRKSYKVNVVGVSVNMDGRNKFRRFLIGFVINLPRLLGYLL